MNKNILKSKLIGEESRKDFVKDYTVEVLRYSSIIEPKVSVSGQPLLEEFYEFRYTHKNNLKDTGEFTCGKTIGSSLIKICGLEAPKLFNPFKSDETDTKSTSDLQKHATKNNNEPNLKRWHPTTKLLHDALCLFELFIDKPLKPHMAKIRTDLTLNSDKEPNFWDIKKLNTATLGYHKTLTQMVGVLKERNPTKPFKQYDFSPLEEILKKKNIKSNF